MVENRDTQQKKTTVVPVKDEVLEDVAGGGKGGQRGKCPACGCATFTDMGGGKIRCTECGWTGTKLEIGL